MSTAQAHVTAEEIAQLNKPRRDAKYWGGAIAGILGIAFIIIYCILPFYWMIVSSLRQPTDGRSTEFLPNPASLENYVAVFAPQNQFGTAILNSVIVSTTTTLLTLVFGILAAYALARLRFAAKGIVLSIIIACSMFPGITLVIPLFKLFSGNYPGFEFINWKPG